MVNTANTFDIVVRLLLVCAGLKDPDPDPWRKRTGSLTSYQIPSPKNCYKLFDHRNGKCRFYHRDHPHIKHYTINSYSQLPISAIGCLLLRCTVIFPSVISCLTLLSVSLDRYLKIVMPLRYHDLMSKRVATEIVISVYSQPPGQPDANCIQYTYNAALTIYGLPLINIVNQTHEDLICGRFATVFNPFYLQFLIFGNILFPLCLICIIYGHIFRVVIQKIRKERRIVPQQQPREGRNNLGNLRHIWFKRERRSIKTLVILLGLCIFGWVPICGVILMEIYNPSYEVGQDVRNVVRSFTFINSAANPIVYSLRGEQFRVYARKFFGIHKGKKMKLIETTRNDATGYPPHHHIGFVYFNALGVSTVPAQTRLKRF
ncbi:LOW QUALITY PROTEIN: adenosine receptor A1-like [Amphiura filiformis]|uniref:LOW QUALITY PROTEIN: adenosine receptor A1-like n=1 Tax=Amphiura filiformis TaxID=82378 RepID=UPI003B21CED6